MVNLMEVLMDIMMVTIIKSMSGITLAMKMDTLEIILQIMMLDTRLALMKVGITDMLMVMLMVI